MILAIIGEDISNFAAVPDRSHQGELQLLCLVNGVVAQSLLLQLLRVDRLLDP